MKVKYTPLLLVLAVLFVAACAPKNGQSGSPEKEEHWKPLFNGKDINDWTVKIHHHETGDNFGNTFRVEDGMIKIRYDQYDSFNTRYGHLYYNQPNSHYKLRFEYRLTGEGQLRTRVQAFLESMGK